MRIGLLSDIHGNLAGLRAVAAALDAEGALDAVVVAGDHLWGGPRPVAVWDLLTERGWLLVRGNADDEVAASSVDDAFPPDSAYHEAARRHHAWIRERLETKVLADLAGLPLHARLQTPAGDLLVVHSSPRSTTDRCGAPHNSAAEVEAAYGGTGAAAIAFGHWHASFVRPTPFALLVNVASVGLPMDHAPLAAYTVLTASPDGWLVEQRRAAYDASEELAAATLNGLPAWVAA